MHCDCRIKRSSVILTVILVRPDIVPEHVFQHPYHLLFDNVFAGGMQWMSGHAELHTESLEKRLAKYTQ